MNKKTDSLLSSKDDMNSRVIKKFFKIIKEDPGLYYGYQANIAMAFQDEVDNYRKMWGSKYLNKNKLHVISNVAAKTFLNRLIKE